MCLYAASHAVTSARNHLENINLIDNFLSHWQCDFTLNSQLAAFTSAIHHSAEKLFPPRHMRYIRNTVIISLWWWAAYGSGWKWIFSFFWARGWNAVWLHWRQERGCGWGVDDRVRDLWKMPSTSLPAARVCQVRRWPVPTGQAMPISSRLQVLCADLLLKGVSWGTVPCGLHDWFMIFVWAWLHRRLMWDVADRFPVQTMVLPHKEVNTSCRHLELPVSCFVLTVAEAGQNSILL